MTIPYEVYKDLTLLINRTINDLDNQISSEIEDKYGYITAQKLHKERADKIEKLRNDFSVLLRGIK